MQMVDAFKLFFDLSRYYFRVKFFFEWIEVDRQILPGTDMANFFLFHSWSDY